MKPLTDETVLKVLKLKTYGFKTLFIAVYLNIAPSQVRMIIKLAADIPTYDDYSLFSLCADRITDPLFPMPGTLSHLQIKAILNYICYPTEENYYNIALQRKPGQKPRKPQRKLKPSVTVHRQHRKLKPSI